MKKLSLIFLIKIALILVTIPLVSFTTLETPSEKVVESIANANLDGKWYSKDSDGTDLGSVTIKGNSATYSKFPTTKVTIEKVHKEPYQPVIYVKNVTNGVAQYFSAVVDEKAGIIRFYNGGTWSRKGSTKY
jgi:hypothetical protein